MPLVLQNLFPHRRGVAIKRSTIDRLSTRVGTLVSLLILTLSLTLWAIAWPLVGVGFVGSVVFILVERALSSAPIRRGRRALRFGLAVVAVLVGFASVVLLPIMIGVALVQLWVGVRESRESTSPMDALRHN